MRNSEVTGRVEWPHLQHLEGPGLTKGASSGLWGSTKQKSVGDFGHTHIWSSAMHSNIKHQFSLLTRSQRLGRKYRIILWKSFCLPDLLKITPIAISSIIWGQFKSGQRKTSSKDRITTWVNRYVKIQGRKYQKSRSDHCCLFPKLRHMFTLALNKCMKYWGNLFQLLQKSSRLNSKLDYSQEKLLLMAKARKSIWACMFIVFWFYNSSMWYTHKVPHSVFSLTFSFPIIFNKALW